MQSIALVNHWRHWRRARFVKGIYQGSPKWNRHSDARARDCGQHPKAAQPDGMKKVKVFDGARDRPAPVLKTTKLLLRASIATMLTICSLKAAMRSIC
jgi:hypothetical protein